MWMTENQLVYELVAHVGNVKLLLFLSNLCIEADVQQHVAQLFTDVGLVVVHERVAQLISFFYGVWPQTLVCLFLVPWTFGEAKEEQPEGEAVSTAQQVIENWEQIKLKEKDGNKSVLSGVPAALPALIKAYRIQDKARNVGFDWEDKGDVWAKVREELGELETELRKEDKEHSEEEFGDFLFSLINAGRLYKLNPDTCLEKTNKKFIRRFNYIEEHSIKIGKPLKDLTLGEMDQLWNEAKEQEKLNKEK